MSLRMVHLIAFYTEGGFALGSSDTHMDRDSLYEEAVQLWKDEGNTDLDGLPIDRLDVLVPFEDTDEEALKQIEDALVTRQLVEVYVFRRENGDEGDEPELPVTRTLH